MRGEKLILVLWIFLSACSTVKYTGRALNNFEGKEFIDLEHTSSMNISSTDYNVIKALIKVTSPKEKNEFLVNFKYKKPDLFLASLKSKTGIEAARIYISKDTVLINDRLNKRLYYGSSRYLTGKYGININNLHILVGDYLAFESKKRDSIKCENGSAIVTDTIGSKTVEYWINCSTGKITDTFIGNGNEQEMIHISFGNLRKGNPMELPGDIKIFDKNNEMEIEIKIEKFSKEPVDEIVFVPGKDYNKILLKW